MGDNRKYTAAAWQKAGLSVLCVILALILIVLIFVTAYAQYLLGLVSAQPGGDYHETLSSEDMATATEEPDDSEFTGPSVGHDDVTLATLPSVPVQPDDDGIINIMLIGEDRRPGEPRQRSDSMILCTFNTNKNTITMTSFLRDTYVAIPGYSPNKMNAAYQFGGTKCLNETLAVNFGVHVDANVMVDFTGFQDVIELLGGVDVSLTQKEVKYLNDKYGWGLKVGLNHLNGEQALAYSRIRKIDMDAMRAQRQRTVLTALINEYKNKDISTMLSIATEILESKMVQTDMTQQEIVNYILQLFPMLANATINTQQIPANGTYTEMTVGTITYAKVPDLAANRKILSNILENWQ